MRADDGDLVLTNRLDETVDYYALEEGMSAAIDVLPGAFQAPLLNARFREIFDANTNSSETLHADNQDWPRVPRI